MGGKHWFWHFRCSTYSRSCSCFTSSGVRCKSLCSTGGSCGIPLSSGKKWRDNWHAQKTRRNAEWTGISWINNFFSPCANRIEHGNGLRILLWKGRLLYRSSICSFPLSHTKCNGMSSSILFLLPLPVLIRDILLLQKMHRS
jgi:hypothetical protein